MCVCTYNMKSLSLSQISAAHELKFIIVATRKVLKISAKRYVAA